MDRKTVVLLVEDNYVLLEMLTNLCERAGLKVFAASSGEDALTLLRRSGGRIDWLFTDINLPGLIDGWTVAEAYRAFNPRRPVIYASVSPRPARVSATGGVFFRKPFHVAEIVELARMMARAEHAVPLRAAS
ncbi:MAG: response regulator [Methylobacterium sp.]|uniref:response regulator n=1 Tax=Methylobacterium sp. TaxID=409 RepID=UPI0025F044AE|nr:response regulator [Methylobacterium sp.]MBX9930443.1 response regulator [Methylobacterium sp.]